MQSVYLLVFNSQRHMSHAQYRTFCDVLSSKSLTSLSNASSNEQLLPNTKQLHETLSMELPELQQYKTLVSLLFLQAKSNVKLID